MTGRIDAISALAGGQLISGCQVLRVTFVAFLRNAAGGKPAAFAFR
jgi:hypothetical protein